MENFMTALDFVRQAKKASQFSLMLGVRKPGTEHSAAVPRREGLFNLS